MAIINDKKDKPAAIECDSCGAVFKPEEPCRSFKALWAEARGEGFRYVEIPSRTTKPDMEHRCGDCED